MITLQTNHGDIVIELDFENTPETAKNFLNYATNGFYDNTIFHRVIDNFMVQGGGFTEDMKHKDGDAPIKNEANKGGKNLRGTLAMARTSDPHSASSQFFINVKDNDFLNFTSESPNGWGYCVFGKVTSGMDVVDKIRKIPTGNAAGHQDVPKDKVIIEKVVVAEEVAAK
jgi:peptidyl-prolyl cis-trans isomerase B (cyclophilin B)